MVMQFSQMDKFRAADCGYARTIALRLPEKEIAPIYEWLLVLEMFRNSPYLIPEESGRNSSSTIAGVDSFSLSFKWGNS